MCKLNLQQNIFFGQTNITIQKELLSELIFLETIYEDRFVLLKHRTDLIYRKLADPANSVPPNNH